MSSRGFGGIVRSNRTEPPDNGTITGMQNGLSSVANKGELGGNPLLHDTAIDAGGFEFIINDPSVGQPTTLRISGNLQEYSLGNFNTGTGLGLDTNSFTVKLLAAVTVLAFSKLTNRYTFGDIDQLQQGATAMIDDLANEFVISNAVNNMTMRINGTAGFSGTVAAPASITVVGGIVTNVT